MASFKLVFYMVVVALVSGFLVHNIAPKTEPMELPVVIEVEEKPNYSVNVQMQINQADNICKFVNSKYFDETFRVTYPDKVDDTIGRWNSDTFVIELMQPGGLDVDTVAHEVSHAVDTMMALHPDVDPHYAHYIQGRLTLCVMSILGEDLEAASLRQHGW